MKKLSKMRKYIILFLIISCLGFFACEKFLEPKAENTFTNQQLVFDAGNTEGLLMKAYYALPNDYNFETDVASDDAVTNDPTSVYRSMAIGGWRSTNDPISQWATSFEQIYYINRFLDQYQSVLWSTDPTLTDAVRASRNNLHKRRLRGEAFAIRAWYKWRLLQYHGGLTADNRLLGFPIIDQSITPADNWKIPRNTYAECVTSIFNDLDTATKYLPATWFDRPIGGTNPPANADTNATMGARYDNRINGNIATALKARVALLAASPSFSASSGVTWAQAAATAGPLMKKLGALYANGRTFYKEIRTKEILWNQSGIQKRTWEQNNFPPSLFGNGRTNPTQDLVDAFPMKNGYPITHPSSGYAAATPYTNRDPRLTDYIVYNTATLKSTSIKTYVGAPSDGINVLLTSTRTGYYLKKLLSESVNLDPTNSASTSHNYTLVRMTELLLNFCEAANEAWGPDGDPNGYGFTARTKIRDLRIRAGITQPDAYLNSITDQAGLRALIRNERRIELCFEGFRFWDIRRWNDITTMQTSVKEAYITLVGAVYSYSYAQVEDRLFSDYMIYGPVPYSETLKYGIDQNKGW
jgi:hypothetical protein